MKKIPVLSLMLVLLLLLVSCGTHDSSSDAATDSQSSSNLDSIGNTNNDNRQAELSEMIAEFQRTGSADPNIFPLLSEALPETFTFTFNEKEVYASSLAEQKQNDIYYEEYDYLFNWEYPLTFKTEREELFELLSQIDGVVIQIDGSNIVNTDAIIFVEKCGYGTYQRIAPYDNTAASTLLYYGNTSNNRPNGVGILLQEDGSGIIPIFAGHFDNGLIKGYGMWLTSSISYSGRLNGIKSEGYFDYTTESTGDGPYDIEGSYGNLKGEGIVYYNGNSEQNYALADIIYTYNENPNYDDMINPNSIIEYTIMTNYPVQRPKVQHEGTYENGNLLEGTEYYMEDTCYGSMKSSGIYRYDLIYNGVFLCPDGTCLNGAFSNYSQFIGGIYYPSGKIQFIGTLSGFYPEIADIVAMNNVLSDEGFSFDTGTLYEEDGAVQGTIENGDFEWS